jgi:hypothetical protein
MPRRPPRQDEFTRAVNEMARKTYDERGRLRHNPPLSEHMVHDSIHDIVEGLTNRFVGSAAEAAASGRAPSRGLVRFVHALSESVGRTAEAHGLKELADDASDVHEALAEIIRYR